MNQEIPPNSKIKYIERDKFQEKLKAMKVKIVNQGKFMLSNDDYESAPRLSTEYRRCLIIQCPDCIREYEENECAIAEQAINQCPKCKFIWVNEL